MITERSGNEALLDAIVKGHNIVLSSLSHSESLRWFRAYINELGHLRKQIMVVKRSDGEFILETPVSTARVILTTYDNEEMVCLGRDVDLFHD